MLQFIGYTIQVIDKDNNRMYVEFNEDLTEMKFSDNPYLFQPVEKDKIRNIFMNDFNFKGSPPYPFMIKAWQTVEVYINSNI